MVECKLNSYGTVCVTKRHAGQRYDKIRNLLMYRSPYNQLWTSILFCVLFDRLDAFLIVKLRPSVTLSCENSNFATRLKFLLININLSFIDTGQLLWLTVFHVTVTTYYLFIIVVIHLIFI